MTVEERNNLIERCVQMMLAEVKPGRAGWKREAENRIRAEVSDRLKQWVETEAYHARLRRARCENLENWIWFLETGAGWARPGVPMMLGRWLRRLGLDGSTPISVKTGHQHHGQGSLSWSEYWWEVEGLDGALQSQSILGTAAVFGGPPDLEVEVTGDNTIITHRSGAVPRWGR